MIPLQNISSQHLLMHPITLSFDKESERKFLHFYFTYHRDHMRLSMLLGILIWGLFGLLEIWFYPKEILWSVLSIRYIFVWPLMMLSPMVTYLKKADKFIGASIALGIIACAFGTILKFAILSSHPVHYNPIPSLIIIFLYGYAVMRARFIWASLTGFIIVVFYSIVILITQKSFWIEFASDSFFLIMANFIGMYIAYAMELFSRKDFLYSKKIKNEKRKTEEVNQQLKSEITERCLIEEKLHQHQDNLERIVQARTQELENTQHEIIHMLGLAAEYRDGDTGQHVKKMSRYCVALAQAVGLPEKSCELLFYASQMHDVGKLGIPDSILLKPGQLTDEEWEIMKKHTVIGAEILSRDHSPLLETAKTIALLHHERWNGTGYPKGLKRENIPLLARIVCLCDVFDALTSNRPYKKSWPFETALGEINRLKGSCLDPFLVEKFNKISPVIKKIHADFTSSGFNLDATFSPAS